MEALDPHLTGVSRARINFWNSSVCHFFYLFQFLGLSPFFVYFIFLLFHLDYELIQCKFWRAKENCNTSLVEDDDIDGDGFNNTVELLLGTNPESPSSRPIDYDLDGIPDQIDDDIDNDGMNNTLDLCPNLHLNFQASNVRHDYSVREALAP